MRNGLAKNCGFFFAGALVGGAAALLTTPATGRRMRRMVRQKLAEASGQLSEATDQLREGAHELYARGEKAVREGAFGR